MSKPLIPDHVWVDQMYEALRKELPNEDEAKLRAVAEECIAIAKNRGAQMRAARLAKAREAVEGTEYQYASDEELLGE